MISKTLILIGVIAAVQGTFKKCPPFESLSFFKCGDNCLGNLRTCRIGLGCTCILGYKRNASGTCVPKRDCCTGENERYCEYNSDKTCADIIGRTIISHWPNWPNKGRCCCKEGTVRDENKNCVPEYQCYPTCTGANEVYKTQGCDTNCNLKGVDEDECIIRPNGCYCQDGYARQNPDDTDCKLQTECECEGPNECYIESGGCEKNCEGINCLECPGRPGCYCSDGYVRENKSLGKPKCIPYKKCKKHCATCGENGEGAVEGDDKGDVE